MGIKRIVATVLCVMLLCGAGFVQAADTSVVTPEADKVYNITDDGTVTVNHSAPAGGYVTLNVLCQSGGSIDWDDIIANTADSAKTSKIEYYEIIKADAQGKAEFNFVLEDSGKYLCYIADTNGLKAFVLNHINEGKRNAAEATLKGIDLVTDPEAAKDAIETAVEGASNDFGLFSDTYDVSATEDVSEILYEFLTEYDTADGKYEDYQNDIAAAVAKAYLTVAVNNDSINNNILGYSEELNFEMLGISDYVKADRNAELSQKIQSKTYQTIKEFDLALKENVVGLTINYNNGTDEIVNAIKACADDIGVDSAKVTSSLAGSIAGSDAYYSFSTLKTYIDNYTPTPAGGGGGGGGGGGLTTPSKNDMTGDPISYDRPEQNIIGGGISVFDDIDDNHWAKEYITTLYNEGVVSGKTVNEFFPSDNVKREEYVKLAVTSMNINTKGDELPFEDVAEDAWYRKYVCIAFHSDIINGVSENEFGIGMDITRQDLAVITYNLLTACKFEFAQADGTEFKDAASIASYAKDAVKYLKSSGILSGDENGYFNPNAKATRAEAAKIIYMISR